MSSVIAPSSNGIMPIPVNGGNGVSNGHGLTSASGIQLGDGSWELRVLVTDLQVERTLRVKGELHVGGVMLLLVDELGKAVTC